MKNILLNPLQKFILIKKGKNQQLSQQMDKEKLNLKKLPLQNWVNQETWSFLSSLSFRGYILAGNSVANMAEGIPLQGDLDFWAYQSNTYMDALQEIGQYYQQFYLYPSMIEMKNKNSGLPKINLVYANLEPIQTIQKFDLDYCRCFWFPEGGIVFQKGCYQSIKTKIIKKPLQKITSKRILKAIKYGYVFQKEFWSTRSHLLANQRKKLFWNTPNGDHPYPIRLQDLDMQKFVLKKINLKVRDVNNINGTLLELKIKLDKISGRRNVKLPVLLKFKKKDFDLLIKYAIQVVLKNPLSDADYLQLNIGRFYVGYRNTDDYLYLTDQSEMVSEQSQKQQIIAKKPSNPSQTKTNKSYYYTKNIVCDKSSNKTVMLDQLGSAFIKLSFLSPDLLGFCLEQFDSIWFKQINHKYLTYRQKNTVNPFYHQQIFDRRKSKQKQTETQQSQQIKDIDQLPYALNCIYKYMKNKENYNEITVNWQTNIQDFIIPDYKKKLSQICILSLYSAEQQTGYRSLEITPKTTTTKFLQKKLSIRLDHGLLLTMMGKTLELFQYNLRKQNRETLSRINIIFRHT